MGNKTEAGYSEPRILLQELASKLDTLVVREHQILQEELEQLSTLLKDAISTLEGSFQEVNRQLTAQSQLVSSIVETLQDSEEHYPIELDKVVEFSEQINKSIATSVRSLQFEDIIQQLVAHSRNRAGQVEQLFVKLGKKVETLKAIKSGDDGGMVQAIYAMQVDLEDFRSAVGKENPVKQISMCEGKIELF